MTRTAAEGQLSFDVGAPVVERPERPRARPAAPAPAAPHVELPVRVKRSPKRRKTVSARIVDGVLEVSVPSWMSRAEQERWADEMRRRHLRRATTADIDLDARIAALARRYDLPRPTTVRWGEMTAQWGSCTTADGTIRLSTRLAAFPPWVLDYVVVHELAHLVHGDHSPAFWALVQRYPKAERAIGYLIARSDDADEPTD